MVAFKSAKKSEIFLLEVSLRSPKKALVSLVWILLKPNELYKDISLYSTTMTLYVYNEVSPLPRYGRVQLQNLPLHHYSISS